LQGKIERFGSKLQVVNPKKISKIGEIVPKYKCKLRQDVYRRIVETLITLENLKAQGLDEARSSLIVRAHKPDDTWLRLYRKYGGLGPKTVEALKFAEALDYFQRLKGKRIRFSSISKLTGSIEPFLEKLPFELTNDQKRAIEDISNDLKSEFAARRMIVGDVGSGKTMVILASAMMAYPNRAILMAPTSILARQLYEEHIIIELTVEDTGTGISKKNIDSIFNSFSSSGTGIGLHLCKELLKSMDGEIGVDSTEGKGAIFTVTFPLRLVPSDRSSNPEDSAEKEHEQLQVRGKGRGTENRGKRD
jgi:hypothetical protein